MNKQSARREGPFFRVAMLVLVVALLVAPLNLVVFGSQPALAAIGVRDKAKINQLIYPTIGNPAIVKSGESLVVEWDPRLSNPQPMPGISAFRVTVTSSNDIHPVTRTLQVKSFDVETTQAWPMLKENNWAVFRVEVEVPYSVPRDLYDVTVSALTESTWVTDTQLHGLSVVNEYKDRFSFCQLTDIHVFGPELSYPSSNQKERSARRETWDPDVGYGATYFHKAIQQLNRIKPDFCIFTGDYMFGQKYRTQNQGAPWGTTTEYEFEMLWFYQELTRLDIPVFMTIGNHDGYNEGTSGAGEDWIDNWRLLFGPEYYSFGYGPDYHFTVLNSMDWPPVDREMFNWLGIIMQPNKYLGCLNGNGDSWNGGGVTEAELNAINPGMLTGQLKWARDELAGNQHKKMRLVSLHHDPWKSAGSGSMWDGDPVLNMGDGPGRIALLRLMRDYGVAMQISGHDHSDNHELVDWSAYGGSGQTIMCNTTSTSFQSDGDSMEYPGYQRVWINNGVVESKTYQDPKYSYPFYDGTNIEGNTNLGSLSVPAIESSWTGTPGNSQDLTCTITNHLDLKGVPGAYAEFPMPFLSGGYYYRVQNGSLGDVYDNRDSSPTHRVYQVYTDVAPGSSKAPRVFKSASPDRTPPSGSLRINNGADVTTSREVTLNIDASDNGAGVGGMMVSNRSDFAGAQWEAYSGSRPWVLSSGEAGSRKVYVKVRDMAMPSNVRNLNAGITYAPLDESGGPARTWYFAEGCTRAGFEEWISLQNPNDAESKVEITYMTDSGENIGQLVTVQPFSRSTVNVNEVVGPGKDVSAVVTSDRPILAERPMYFNYHGMWTGGHGVIGVNKPRAAWYFAEGCTRNVPDANFHTWLCMQNPGDNDAQVEITYMPEGEEPVVKQLTLPAKTRTTSCANWDIGPGKDVSMMVTASKAIICERSMYFSVGGWNDGHDVMGAAAPANEWFLAEGTTHDNFVTYVCLQNPGDEPAQVALQYMPQVGRIDDQAVEVPARSRRTVNVNDWVGPAQNISMRALSDKPVITERSMYFIYNPAAGSGGSVAHPALSGSGAQSGWDGGHCVLGTTSVHKKWYFAEGCTRKGFQQWFSIQNPSDNETEVRIDYVLEDGSGRQQVLRVASHSRVTVRVNEFLGYEEHDVSATVTSQSGVIVERPMYFAYGGYWTGGHCVVGSGVDP